MDEHKNELLTHRVNAPEHLVLIVVVKLILHYMTYQILSCAPSPSSQRPSDHRLQEELDKRLQSIDDLTMKNTVGTHHILYLDKPLDLVQLGNVSPLGNIYTYM